MLHLFFAVKHEDIIRECLTEHFNETLEAGEMMTREDMDAQMMDVISEMYPELGSAEEELTEAVTE